MFGLSGPDCLARIGERCKDPSGRPREAHAARLAKLSATQQGAQKYGSVYTVRGRSIRNKPTPTLGRR